MHHLILRVGPVLNFNAQVLEMQSNGKWDVDPAERVARHPLSRSESRVLHLMYARQGT